MENVSRWSKCKSNRKLWVTVVGIAAAIALTSIWALKPSGTYALLTARVQSLPSNFIGAELSSSTLTNEEGTEMPAEEQAPAINAESDEGLGSESGSTAGDQSSEKSDTSESTESAISEKAPEEAQEKVATETTETGNRTEESKNNSGNHE